MGIQRQLLQHLEVSAFAEVKQKSFCPGDTWPSSEGGGKLTDCKGDSSRGELEDITNIQGNP